MMRNDTRKNAEQDDVNLVEQNVSEYSPDEERRRRSFHSTVEGMFCHKCGMKKMEPDQKFCSGCGVAFMYIGE